MPRLRKRGQTKKKNRWGSIKELDGRIHVGTKAFKSMPRRLQQLSAWRRMNSEGHASVRQYGNEIGIRPSSNIPLHLKVKYATTKISK